MLSERQREILNILARRKEPVEWGTVWDDYTWADLSSPLVMVNFDRVTNALVRKGLVAYDDGLVIITDTGRKALDK